jgi:hypothetical protein
MNPSAWKSSEQLQHSNNITTGNCIYTQHQIGTSQSTYKQPERDTQNNVFSLHTVSRKVKTPHDLYSEERSQQADVPQYNMTTTVEQQTTYDM